MSTLIIGSQPAERFLTSLCSLDAGEVTDQLSEDARLSFGKSLIAAGKPKLVKALKRGFAALHSLRCVPAMIWAQGNVSVVEADVSCERLDGSWSTFPVTVILCFRDDLISDIRLFTYEPALVSFL